MDAIKVDDKTQGLNHVNVKFALLNFGKQTMLDEAVQDFVNLFHMLIGIVGVNKYVIEVYDNTYVQ